MGYLLLTGATGLVGRYLLKDLLTAGADVAVLARADRASTAQQRVEGVMRHWEEQLGRPLPRPVVLQGDLCRPGLDLPPQQRQWLSRHCQSLLHCAASMTFREDQRGEPFRTNVEGLRNVLAVCRETQIRRFHHVSTAYVCGLRTGLIRESELDLGQPLGNVYEQSKLQAERLVREEDFLEQKTIYRPASVVGDSQTGYVTSYHGFYLPLQLAYAMASRIPAREMNERFFARLGLRGDEGKNLVPVDWLARAIVHLVMHPACHGQTYHLASPRPVAVREVQRVIQEAIGRYSKHPPAKTIDAGELKQYEDLFHDYMSIYQSHWRDDPKFDLTNTRDVLAHLPCPEMTTEVLMRIARYPIERDFVTRRRDVNDTPIDVHQRLDPLVEQAWRGSLPEACDQRIGLQVNGPGGGQWQLLLHQGQVAGAELGLPPPGAYRLYLTANTWQAIARSELTVQQSINAGRLIIEGANGNGDYVAGILEKLVTAA
jgi:thioester reductase-like protein